MIDNYTRGLFWYVTRILGRGLGAYAISIFILHYIQISSGITGAPGPGN
jgi:hypothetical protein